MSDGSWRQLVRKWRSLQIELALIERASISGSGQLSVPFDILRLLCSKVSKKSVESVVEPPKPLSRCRLFDSASVLLGVLPMAPTGRLERRISLATSRPSVQRRYRERIPAALTLVGGMCLEACSRRIQEILGRRWREVSRA